MIRPPPRSTLFPYTRSSDLPQVPADVRVLADYQKVPTSMCMWSGPTPAGGVVAEVVTVPAGAESADLKGKLVLGDRKSTRLNSSHSQISYAVFCLKKKKNNT